MLQTQFSSDEREAICQSLGDSPFTVITLDRIRQGTVNMVLIGSVSDIQGVVVQLHDLLEEPNAFGTDASAIMQCLQQIQGWTCVNVDCAIADELAALMKETLNKHIRHYGDVHFILEHPITIAEFLVDQVELRLLTERDVDVLDNAPTKLLMSELGAYVAGAIVGKRVVALAHAHAKSERYADVGVSTDEAWRNRGISTYLSQLVMQKLQSDGYVPVWSTGEDNLASRRVAEKLGMTMYGNRMYLILEESL